MSPGKMLFPLLFKSVHLRAKSACCCARTYTDWYVWCAVCMPNAHAANRKGEKLVDRRAHAIVDGSHGLGAAHAGKVEVLGVVVAQARTAGNRRRCRLGRDVVAERRVARLARDAWGSERDCSPHAPTPTHDPTGCHF